MPKNTKPAETTTTNAPATEQERQEVEETTTETVELPPTPEAMEPQATDPKGTPEERRADWLQHRLQFGKVKKADTPDGTSASAADTFAAQAAREAANRSKKDEERIKACETDRDAFRKAAQRDIGQITNGVAEYAIAYCDQKPTYTIDDLVERLQEKAARLKARAITPKNGTNGKPSKADEMAAEVANDELRRAIYGEVIEWSSQLHPDYLVNSVSPTGATLIIPVRKGLDISTRALLGGLSTVRDERIDEIVRQSRRATGPMKKMFEDADKYGGLIDDFTGGDENIVALASAHILTFDRGGEIINFFRLVAKCATMANEGKWLDAAETFDVLCGKSPIRKNESRTYPFAEDTVLKAIQGRIYALHGFAMSDMIKTIKDAQNAALTKQALDKANIATNLTTTPTEAPKSESVNLHTETNAAAPEDQEENRRRAQETDIKSTRAAILQEQKRPEKEWNKDRMANLIRSVAKYHPNYAEYAERRKIAEQNPQTDDKRALTQDQFKAFCLSLGREILDLDGNYKPIKPAPSATGNTAPPAPGAPEPPAQDVTKQ